MNKIIILIIVIIVGLGLYFKGREPKNDNEFRLNNCAGRFYVGAKGTTYESVKENCRNGKLPLD